MGLGKSNYQAPQPEFKILGEQVDPNRVITTSNGQVAWGGDSIFIREKDADGQLGDWQRYINKNALVDKVASFVENIDSFTRRVDDGRSSVFENIGIMNKNKILNIIADEVKFNFKD